MINIVGLDVGRNNAVAAAVDHFPANPKAYFVAHRREFVRLKPDARGLTTLAALNPDAIVLEPTGGHYAAIWYAWATVNNISVFWVGHADLAYQRGSYGFQNKRDDEDAFCLALTYFDERFIDRFGRARFLNPTVNLVVPLREKFLQLEQLDKNKTAFINQVRQRLCKEFPESSVRRVEASKKLGYSPFWGWLAGLYTYSQVKNDYAHSVAHSLGISISEFTREHAYQIVLLEKRIHCIETEIAFFMQHSSEFQPYLRVFRRFGFGFVNQILLLISVYPFEKFLIDGKPWIDWEESQKPELKSKLEKRNRSLRSFQAYLGLSYKLKQSGDSLKKKFLGSDLVRSHLYMWAIDRVLFKGDPFPQVPTDELGIHTTPHPKIETEIGELLALKVIQLNRTNVSGSDKVVRVLFRATALLFRELLKELTNKESLE